MKASAELFDKKQKRGVLFGLYARILFSITLTFVTYFNHQSENELIIIFVISSFVIPFLAFSIIRANKLKNLSNLSYAILLVDILFIILLPYIWYESVGSYEKVPSVFLLRNQFPIIVIIGIVFSAFSLNIYQPLVLALLFDCIWTGIIIIVNQDPRTIYTESALEYFMSGTYNIGLVNTYYVITNGVAIAISIFIYTYRESISEAVSLEIESLKLTIINRDLEDASEIQKNTILLEDGIYNRLANYSFYKPYEKIGGDFLCNHRFQNEIVDYIFGDVSGHGIASAMISGMSVLIFKNLEKENQLPAAFLSKMNSHLDKFKFSQNISMVYFRINLSENTLQYSYAGHHLGYLLRGTELILLEGKGSLLLTSLRKTHLNYEYKLEDGDWIFFFSDGLFEIFSRDNILLPYENLISEIHSKLPIKNPKKFLDELVDYVFSYSAGKHNDDITLLLVGYKK
jgi:hypothetical protein